MSSKAQRERAKAELDRLSIDPSLADQYTEEEIEMLEAIVDGKK